MENQIKLVLIIGAVVGLFFITMFVKCSSGSTSKEELMNDFVFKTGTELTAKYGEPKKNYHVDEKSLSWQLEGKTKVKVFYQDTLFSTPEVIRFYYLDVDPDFFYDDFGWRMPKVNKDNFSGKMTYTELYGMKSADYNPNTKILNIILSSPNYQTFGKRIK